MKSAKIIYLDEYRKACRESAGSDSDPCADGAHLPVSSEEPDPAILWDLMAHNYKIWPRDSRNKQAVRLLTPEMTPERS